MSKEQIQSALQQFAQGDLTPNALNLFNILGYNTERQARLDKPIYSAFRESFVDSQSKFNEDKALTKDWKSVDLLFQLSREEILKQTGLFDTRRVDNAVIESYLFFAIKLEKSRYTRTELSHITREVNRLLPMPVSSLKPEGWNLERPDVLDLMEKLKKAGTPLGEYVKGRFYYGIKTGLNDAFVIDAATRDRLVAEDPKSAELIKPWLRGRDIKKWKAEWAGLYVINIASSANHEWPWSHEKTEIKARPVFEKAYPAIHKHLSQWEDKFKKRDDKGKFWWELRSCAYCEEFERPKIMYAEISTDGKFLLEPRGYYSDTTTYIMASDSEYILGILNSKLFTYMFSNVSSEISGGFFRWKRQYMEQLPIPSATPAQKAPIIKLAQIILSDPDSPGVPRLETEIDQLVYALYGLTEEEIAIVEGRNR